MSDSRMHPPPPLAPSPGEEVFRLVIYHRISRSAIYRSAWMRTQSEAVELRAEILHFVYCIGLYWLIKSFTPWRIERVAGMENESLPSS